MLAVILLSFSALALGGETPEDPDDTNLTELSLEELMNIEVTIASRTEEKLSDVPAAVYVLTGDEIRRAGFRNVQEALRMVPGFQVSRFDSSGWSVTARGFSGGFSNNLLVMIDGVSVYTPVFAGVWWFAQDLDIDDVERIEIIRGPGGTLWGTNAVNGIVNVVTKHTADTLGARGTAYYSPEENVKAGRYGGRLGEHGTYRVWALHDDHNSLVDSAGDEPTEDWYTLKAGFRADWDLPSGDQVKFLANGFFVSVEETYFIAFPDGSFQFVTDATPFNGGQLLGSWEHAVSDSVSWKFTGWYTRDHFKEVDFFLTVDSLDLDVQRIERASETWSHVWGLGYRKVLSDIQGDFALISDPEKRSTDALRAYVREEIDLPDRGLSFVLGAQTEYSELTGLELQPSVRALWHMSEHQTLWAAVSRAVRTPSLVELDLIFNIPIGGGDFVGVGTNHDLEAEDLLSFEVGYRNQPSEHIALDATAFYNHYEDLVTIEEVVPPVGGPSYVAYFAPDNLAEAWAYGVEIAADCKVSEDWSLRSAWTYFILESRIDESSNDFFFEETDGASPRHQVNLRTYYDLAEAWELDGGFYWVDDVGFTDNLEGNPAYLRADMRIGYNPSEHFSFSLGVQNACDPEHPEDGANEVGIGSEVERNVYASMVWRP